MKFQESIRTCFRKYFTFSGRASRSEYWWFFLFIMIGNFAFSIVDSALFGSVVVETTVSESGAQASYSNSGPLGGLFSLAVFIPSLAAGWRRMHDSGRSGLFLLYPLIVLVGIGSTVAFFAGTEDLASGNIDAVLESVGGVLIAVSMIAFLISPLLVLWWLTRPSQPGDNQYGPNPHEVTS